MADIRVKVNEQTYALSCGDDEVEHVTKLAAYLDDHVQKLARDVGRVAESRLLILAALNICDELFEARARAGSGRADQDRDSPNWKDAADRAEAIANRIEA